MTAALAAQGSGCKALVIEKSSHFGGSTALSGGGQEARVGNAYELQAIAAVVIGGTLLAGGVGSIVGTLAGIALLYVIQNLIVQGFNLNSYVQQVVSGAFLLIVVVLQAVLSRRSRAPVT